MVAEQHDMRVPTELVPHCPVCGKPMTMNLRCDNTFVQDEGWYAAYSRYESFLRRHGTAKVVYLELGVGGNTPAIIKYPFWELAAQNPASCYVCVNLTDAFCPKAMQKRAICIGGEIGAVLSAL